MYVHVKFNHWWPCGYSTYSQQINFLSLVSVLKSSVCQYLHSVVQIRHVSYQSRHDDTIDAFFLSSKFRNSPFRQSKNLLFFVSELYDQTFVNNIWYYLIKRYYNTTIKLVKIKLYVISNILEISTLYYN